MITPDLLSIVNTKLQIHGAYQGLKDHTFLFPWDSFLPLLLSVVQSIFSQGLPLGVIGPEQNAFGGGKCCKALIAGSLLPGSSVLGYRYSR